MASGQPAFPWGTVRTLQLLVSDCLPGREVSYVAEGHPRLARQWAYEEEMPMHTRLYACGDL
eukprot:5990524-Prorocentrum_lima.AAC.1